MRRDACLHVRPCRWKLNSPYPRLIVTLFSEYISVNHALQKPNALVPWRQCVFDRLKASLSRVPKFQPAPVPSPLLHGGTAHATIKTQQLYPCIDDPCNTNTTDAHRHHEAWQAHTIRVQLSSFEYFILLPPRVSERAREYSTLYLHQLQTAPSGCAIVCSCIDSVPSYVRTRMMSACATTVERRT